MRRGIELAIVMFVNSIFLAALVLMPPLTFLKTIIFSITEKTTILLILFLIMVAFLEKIMNISGQLERMIRAMEQFIPSRRLRLIVMPALLGFLASPGGAMFSAPFVEKAAEPLGISAEEKTFINYWFRHLWEYFLPVYPGVILAIALLNVSYNTFLKLIWIYTPAAILGGIIFGLLPLRLKKKDTAILKKEKSALKEIILGILPIAALLFLVIVLKFDMTLSIFAILLIMTIYYRIPAKDILPALKQSIPLKLLLSVVAIFIFKDLLKVSGIAAGTSIFLAGLGISHVILFFVIPLCVGVLTGVTQAMVGITFPVLIGMLPVNGNLNLFGFAFLCGITGVLLSPVHLCLVLTSEYFHAKISKVYKYLWAPIAFLIAVSIIITLAIK